MRILVYGGGAVGLGLASCLLKVGCRVDIVARENTVQKLRSCGLQRTGIFGSYGAGPQRFNAYTTVTETDLHGYDFIVVCVKSFDTEQAAVELARCKKLLSPAGKTVLFQNGWGNAEKFTALFDESLIYSARVITGFHRPELNTVQITVHADAIHIGSLFHSDTSAVQPLAEAISQGDIPCRTTDHIEKDLWAKMLYNCALNPLGAILQVPYGMLAESRFSKSIMDSVVQEVFAVTTAAGFASYWSRPEDFLKVFYGKLVPDTAAHKSSTLQDILSGKPTEIDALNGAVITLGEQFGIDTAVNRMLYNLIRFIENRQRA